MASSSAVISLGELRVICLVLRDTIESEREFNRRFIECFLASCSADFVRQTPLNLYLFPSRERPCTSTMLGLGVTDFSWCY